MPRMKLMLAAALPQALLLVFAAGLCPAFAQTELFPGDRHTVFEGGPAGIELPDGLSAARTRQVELNPRLSSAVEAAVGERIVLDLFPDAGYEAVVDRVSRNVNGTVAVRARIEGYEFGYMLLVTTGEKSLGTIRIPERGEHYRLVADPGGPGHFLMDVDGRVEVGDGPLLISPAPTPGEAREIELLQSRVTEESRGPEDWADIDVLIVYTPAAAGWAAANDGGIANVVALSMEKAQLSLDNSDTFMSVNLVHSSEVDYVESNGGYDSITDIYRLTFFEGHQHDPHGYMDEVHDWRDDSGADLVALFSLAHDTGGLGWLLNNINGAPAYGFSLTRVQQASWTYTHIHEMGHNMGCHHHKEQNFQPGPTIWHNWPGNIWSAGWRWTGDDGNHYCSLMTYTSGQYFPDGIDHTAVAHFSNPDVVHYGQPSGHPQDGDNARTLRGIKHAVAAYRDRPPVEEPVVGNVQAEQRPASAVFDVTYDLETVDDLPVMIRLFLSTDGGETFPFECRTVSGDVGAGVMPGSGLHIEWNAGMDMPGLMDSNCRLRVFADDSQYAGNFVYIPPGTFTMGSPEDEPERFEWEGPQHEVTLTSGFFMSRYEVTEMLWQQVMGGDLTLSQLPKEMVSWDMAVEFCNALSIMEGLTPAYAIHGPNGDVTWDQDAGGYRLPTEAEWEYACRAGTVLAFNNDTNCLSSDTESNYNGEYPLEGCPAGIFRGASTHAGVFPPNPWGLYDMHGNAYEWVWCGWRTYTDDPQVDPATDVDPDHNRIIRGGGWDTGALGCRSAVRHPHLSHPGYAYPAVGFRVVRTAF